MSSLSCGACGGQLDPTSMSEGAIQCGFCGLWQLMATEGGVSVQGATVAALDDAALVAVVHEHIRRRNMGVVSAEQVTRAALRLVARPTRLAFGQDVLYLGAKPWYAADRVLTIGLPVDDDPPVDVVDLSDVELVPDPDCSLADMARHVDNLEPRLRHWLHRQGRVSAYVVYEGDALAVRLPLAQVEFTLKLNPERPWVRQSADERYTLTVRADTGAVLRGALPGRKTELPVKAIGGSLALLVGAMLLIGFVAVGVPMLFVFGTAGLGCFMGLLGV